MDLFDQPLVDEGVEEIELQLRLLSDFRYLGDSCLVWHNARVGILDTTIVKFNPGLIRVVDSLSIEN